MSQMAKLRAQRRHFWLKDTGSGGTRVQASVLSVPCPIDHGILAPVLPEMLVKAQKNKLHPVPLKLSAGGWGLSLVSPDALLAGNHEVSFR